MSIPFFFKPVKLHLNVETDGKTVKNDARGKKGQPVLIVDGGVSSNFPIWLFDRMDKTPRWPTFGFLLDESKGVPAQHARITGLIIDLAASVISTGMGAMDKRLSQHDEYRTAKLGTIIRIDSKTKQIGTTNFGLSPDEQKALVTLGLNDTIGFLKRFEWADYISWFRR
jgi:NTE family protein